ncbi:SHD1 domain-containing protein [Prosthecobacter sp.]|uniref:SHD1 domain-containing protein n=1 Tax=Prosthecobacter sp. TaxID=1965333 RepID=UPI002AB9AE65|nr:SHD1 domain-containing protein [Prosthecobacter sp.]MDZ4402086.1 SHD1 domain-containing protein [Prosthecobacter sp.]
MKFSRFLCIATAAMLSAVSLAQTTVPPTRIWTSTDGRKIDAAFVALEGDGVKIRMANGSTFTVPLARLSAEDQAFAKSQAPASPATSTASSPSGSPAASTTWPRTVSLEDKPVVTVIKEDAATKEFIYRSPHYEFQCDSKLGANVVREFGRMFEATYLINSLLPLDFKPQPEPLREFFLARLFTEKSDYMKEGIEGSAGVYSRGKKALMVPLSSLGVKMVGSRVSLENGSDQDNVVLIHEITHQMMNHWLNKLPTWYIEGAAEYVSMLEYNSNGRFSLIGLNRLLQNFAKRRNYEGGGKSYTMIDLEELMTIEGDRWSAALGKGGSANENYGSAGLLTYFFYHLDGKGDAANIIAYLRQVQNAKSKEEKQAAVKTHLLRERTYAQLAEEVKKALRKEGIDISYFPPGKNGPATSTN